jgi:hypothetical protein
VARLDTDLRVCRGGPTVVSAGVEGCRTVLVPGADHLLPLRAADRLAAAIAEAADEL